MDTSEEESGLLNMLKEDYKLKRQQKDVYMNCLDSPSCKIMLFTNSQILFHLDCQNFDVK